MEKTVLIQGETPKRCFPLKLDDPLQRRYEFIREAALSKKPVTEICAKYNLSRDMYYYYRRKFDQGGLIALSEEKPGPRRPHKIDEGLESQIIALKFEEPELSIYQLANRLTAKGYDISARSISRVLSEHGLTKKKLSLNPGKVSVEKRSL